MRRALDGPVGEGPGEGVSAVDDREVDEGLVEELVRDLAERDRPCDMSSLLAWLRQTDLVASRRP